ncbi:hypothetical protein A3Q34_19075 [Colwellia sp. PAMC 20917]|uniref:DUF4144 family protein n=1 Tax=Colwellia sp. PAMC 20917 TaxID=1816218 RepID=UPI00087838B4|nr:DUF4144 family protein [Colwellia sp. PAMC 20917]AOW78755.1 hypothetical protein A3Q34_19075 [Colwellia sp. PAMC 20917]
MICWPCVLKLEGEDELTYLASALDFISECQDLILSDEDYVIDSMGVCYLIGCVSQQRVLVKTERTVIIAQVLDLIRAHEFSKAELCLTKIYFLTVADAINSLRY